MAENEFSNIFGTITDDRLTYFRRKTWLRGGSREDVPLKHVTSVRYDVARSVFLGIILILAGFGAMSSGSGSGIFASLLAFFFGALLLWGSPVVAVNTSGNDLNTMTSWPWNRGLAQEFTDTLRKKLFKD